MNSLAIKLNRTNSSFQRNVLGKKDSELKKLSREIAQSISEELIKTVFPEKSSKKLNSVSDKSTRAKNAKK